MNWIEVRLKPEATPTEFYRWLVERDLAERTHHFWDEPWWTNAYVVRMPEADVDSCPLVDHVVLWDPTPDEETFGTAWHVVQSFFEMSSALSTFPVEKDRAHDLRAKLVHCFLNSHGLSRRDEIKFALKYLWGSTTIGIRWRLYLRRRWEREQGPPVRDPA